MKDRRDALLEAFKRQVLERTPGLNLAYGSPNIQVDSIMLSNHTLSIASWISWSNSHEISRSSCSLVVGGFGGYMGTFSPISDNRQMIQLDLR